jgi:hypothetical protein
MRKLVIMEATSQLGLLQVRGNVLIRHFLETGLKKIDFLIFTPSSTPPSRSRLSVFLDPKIMPVDSVHGRVVRRCHMGRGIHLGCL